MASSRTSLPLSPTDSAALTRTSSTAPADTFADFINQSGTGLSTSKINDYDTDRKKIATLGTLLTDKALIIVQPLLSSSHERIRLRSDHHGRPLKARNEGLLSAEINSGAILPETKLPGT
ncbi:hypothetical protein BASA83_011369 [Batrachochytrium salamandrivorans]|nr:hypothetical protein BASA83_011369 [Batrachochytrium salamandrivorans]